MNEADAKQHIHELKGFYGHLASFIGVNLMLAAINLATSPGSLWFIYPLFGWGVGIVCHARKVFWTGGDWEARKLEELTGLKSTQDELQRLSERTDALVTVLAGVDWDRIDPDLLSTRDRLASIRSRIHARGDNAGPLNQQGIAREIETLEEFVTSPEFAFYDNAAAPKDH